MVTRAVPAQAARRFPGLEQAEGPGRGRLEHHGLLRPRISDARRVHADSEVHWADRPSFRRDHLMRMRPRNVAILSGSSDRIATSGKERFKKLETTMEKRRRLRPSEARPLKVPRGLHGSVQVAAVLNSATCGPLVQEPAPAALAGIQHAEAGDGRQAEGACAGERGRER